MSQDLWRLSATETARQIQGGEAGEVIERAAGLSALEHLAP